MNQTQDMMNVIHLGLDNGALALEEQTVGAATMKALAATERRVQKLMVELLVPGWARQDIAQAFAIVRGGIEQMVALDERDHKLARELCGAHEALVARKERAAGKAAHRRCLRSSKVTRQGYHEGSHGALRVNRTDRGSTDSRAGRDGIGAQDGR